MTFDAKSVSLLLREVLEDLNYEFRRDASQKAYTRLMMIMPMTKYAYVFRFHITKPSEFIIDLYDTQATHSGMLHFIEIHEINEKNIKDIRKVLDALIKRMPRKPWEFTLAQRLMTGYLTPEYLRARMEWRKMGFE